MKNLICPECGQRPLEFQEDKWCRLHPFGIYRCRCGFTVSATELDKADEVEA